MATKRIKKRFRLPDYCDVREVVMRELDGRDELEASLWADKHESSAKERTAFNRIQAEQHESIRLSLVSVDGMPVNVDGVPFMEMDDWSMRTMNYITRFYMNLNGVENEDIKRAVDSGEIVADEEPALQAAK